MWFLLWISLIVKLDMEQHYKKNYARFVPCKELGIRKDSEMCQQKWKEIDSFYDTICKGDFIEKYIYVSILVLRVLKFCTIKCFFIGLFNSNQ